ncbi:hypothetical protein QVD17_41864 [Tagetes erecta]|uniref:GOLD domain-containing protein n=1 Tax=Tagetes erecta TaxID=13708 RepID=A0AAD8JL66_TARER|nr:hypothetical protein QVD17_41864 [Tagetes erecta]
MPVTNALAKSRSASASDTCSLGLLTTNVTSAYGNSYHAAENVQSGQFAFQAVEAGDYMACFFAIDHQPPLKISIEFDWRTDVAAKDWSNIAKKGSVDAMEYELKKLADTITSIHEEMFNLRERLVNNLSNY